MVNKTRHNFRYNPDGSKYNCCENCRNFIVQEPDEDFPEWEWRCEKGCFCYHKEDEGHIMEYDYQVCDELDKVLDLD